MIVKRLLRQVGGAFGLLICTGLVLSAVLAPWIAPHDPNSQVLAQANLPPVWSHAGVSAHLLGTDELGRDVLSRVIYGARVSLIIGASTVVIQTLIGVALGIAAGYRGGWLDAGLMRLADVWLAIPFLVLAITVAVLLGPGLKNLVLVLSVIGWVTFARVVRAETLSIRERDAVVVARALGSSPLRIIWRHILPNVAPSIIVVATLQVSRMILGEAALSYLGLGVQPPDAAWGSMIAAGRNYLSNEWWLSTMPGLALLLTTLGINLLGDSLREVLDPRLSRR